MTAILGCMGRKSAPLLLLALSTGCAALAGLDADFVIGNTMTSTVSNSGGSTGSGGAATSGGSTAAGGEGGQAGARDWLTGYDARKSIRFAPTKAPLGDFVAAVILETDPDLAGATQPAGEDLAFTSEDGVTQLSHELEHFDASTGSLVAWVRLPQLAGQDETPIYLYWGNAIAVDQQDPAGTWTDRYAGVWHLATSPTAGIRDSSRNHNDGQLLDPSNAPAQVRGIAGGGLQFAGNGETVGIPEPNDDSLDFGTGSFAYSVWVLVTSSAGSWDMPWFKGGSSAGNAGYDFELGTSSWNAGVSDGTQIRVVSFGAETDFLGAWVHLVAVVDRATTSVIPYANAVAGVTGDISGLGSLSTALPASIGHPNYTMLGRVDEVRVYAESLSPEWIDAEYRNLADPTSFYTVGPAEKAY